MHALLRTQKYKALLNNFLLHAVNSDECIMTRIQEMSLDYHFSVEQEVGSSTYSFFGFNGKLVSRLTKLFIEEHQPTSVPKYRYNIQGQQEFGELKQ